MSLLPLWFVAVFLVGLAAGSFLNLCAIRLPYEKALLWPGPRCDSCRQPVGLLDCLPLVGFLRLKGRCRACGKPIPWSYPVVEVFTALVFVGLLALVYDDNDPWATLVVFSHRAVLVGLLIVAAVCDLEDMEIPMSLTVSGTVIGLVFATLFPWPFPDPPGAVAHVPPLVKLYPWPSLYPWPVWYPLPDWLPPGSPQLGLATGLAGALAGMILLRGVRFLFGLGRGLEGMGVGDADLMMMAGAFIGWQPVTLAFFVSVLPGLGFALVSFFRKGHQPLPFGPALGMGVVLTVLFWPMLGNYFRLGNMLLFFEPLVLGVVFGGGAVGLLLLAFLLRLLRSI
jgi:leader peptidase (prepilin peptidase)/N-methyltransferase